MMAGPTGHLRPARSQGFPMTRPTLLVAGAICWTVAGVDAAAHLFSGDVLVPAVMGAVFAVWVGLRRYQMTRSATPTEEALAA